MGVRHTAMAINAKTWAPVGTFVAVLGVGAAAVLVGGGDGSGPRPLRLADSGIAAKDSAALAAPASGMSAGYRLTGSLPEGRPDDALAWTLPTGPGPAAPVARLAKALGEGTPTHDGDGWRAGGLTVTGQAGRTWWWSSCGGPSDAASSDGAVACAATPAAGSGSGVVSGGGSAPVAAPAVPPTCSISIAPHADGSPLTDDEKRSVAEACSGYGDPGTITVAALPPSPAPLPPTPTEDVVRRAVAPVLDALGLSNADVHTYAGGGSAMVRATVGGREVTGLGTTVSVDAAGAVVAASGWLGSPEQADTYPLVTAKEAFDVLPPRAVALMCPFTPNGGCQAPGPVEITGAHLGLTVAPLEDGGQVLVPAWLFEVKGGTEPVPAVAVQPQYLPQPDPAQDDPAPSEPAIEPGTPDSVPPAEARGPLSFDSAFRGDVENAVVVQYGDSGTCPHTHVTSAAKEDATTVYVALEADLLPPDVVCTADYKPVRVKVELQAPLSDRKVVDASTGKQVPLS